MSTRNNFRGSRHQSGRPTFHQRSQSRGPKKENIHPSKYVQKARSTEQVAYQPSHTFDDFSLAPQLAAQVRNRGFTQPSPIQDQIIPYGLAGRDVIGIANTGTGKTMAFALPIINRLLKDRDARALIMAPTRELAEQVLEECKTLLAPGSGVYWALLIGGTSMTRQLHDLKRSPRLIIGTPGRTKDHLERGSLQRSAFNLLVLDEVDRMLDMGFVRDIRMILENTRAPETQSFFFSATINPSVDTIIQEFSSDPVKVSVITGTTADTVEQDIVHFIDDEDKLSKLNHHIADKNRKVLIFDDTRRQVEKLTKALTNAGMPAGSIHGGKNQSQRRRALDKFKSNELRILVATDVAARGIDVDGVTHVINYSTPQSYADYTHRIGRAGRAGKAGYALTFLQR